MRRRLICAVSAITVAGGLGLGVAAPAMAQPGEGPVLLCQFADAAQVRDGDCIVGDVAADGVTVINPDGPVYGDVPESRNWDPVMDSTS